MLQQNDTLLDLIKLAWKQRVGLALSLAAGLVAGAILLMVLKPQYEARMIVAPAIHDYQDKLLAARKFASPTDERYAEHDNSREFTKFEQIFREVTVARALTVHIDLLPSVNRDGVFRFTQDHVRDAGSLSNYLKREIKIYPIGATSSRLMIYRHPDPLFAILMLKSLHRETDRLIREDVKQHAENRILYLQKELQNAYNPEHRAVLADLLMAEEQDRLLSSMDTPFAADVIEEPSASLRPVWPKAGVILPACALMGLLIGVVIAAIRRDPL